jgi:hypothetical protein
VSIPVSASYIAVEAATTRAEMNFYMTFRKTALPTGTVGATTAITKSGNSLSLRSGAIKGSWISASFNTSHPVLDSVFRLVWTEDPKEGQVAAYIRTATQANELGNVPWTSASAMTNSILSHYRRKKWAQTKIVLSRVDAASDSPEVSGVSIEGRAIVPNSEIINFPDLQMSVGKDFLGVIGSKTKAGFDNKNRQWDELYAQSYIYGRNYLEDEIDLYAGLKINSNKTEYLPMFSGKMEQIELDSISRSVQIVARGRLLDKLSTAVIGGKNIGTGQPSPYGAGRRYRDLLVETNSASRIWNYYLKQSITSINNVYTRNVENNLWRTIPTASYTASITDKTITFAANVNLQGDVAMDVTINSLDHPVEVIKDVLDNEVSVKYNASQLDKVVAGYPDFSVGVKLEDASAFDIVSKLARVLDVAVYESGDKLNFVSLQTMLPSTITVETRDYKNIRVNRGKLKIANKYTIPYGDYWDDRSNVVASSDSQSIASFGVRDISVIYGGEYSYTYEDQISCNESGPILHLVTKLKLRLPFQKETFSIESVYSKPLRMELGDKMVVNNPFFGFSDKLVAIHDKSLSLKERKGNIGAMGYTLYDQFLFAPSGALQELASWFVSTPIPSSQVSYIAYFF